MMKSYEYDYDANDVDVVNTLLSIIKKRGDEVPNQADKYTLTSNLYCLTPDTFSEYSREHLRKFDEKITKPPKDWGISYGQDLICSLYSKLRAQAIPLSYFQLIYAIRTKNIKMAYAMPLMRNNGINSKEHVRFFITLNDPDFQMRMRTISIDGTIYSIDGTRLCVLL